MAWRLDQHLIKGEIQNRIPGKVTGLIWLKGLNQPVELKLKGNCYRDLAGAKLVFENPEPTVGDYTGLEICQEGVVGDITASKKVKIPVDTETAIGEFVDGQIPYVIGNCLYLEWFSERNGRVLIETTDYRWTVTLPHWSLSENEEIEQRLMNQQAMFDFMDNLANAIEPEDDPLSSSGEMNEFQWEAYLQKSDARTNMLMELFEKYGDDPNCEELVAKAVGWEIESIDYPDEQDELWNEDGLLKEGKSSPNGYLPNHPLISEMMDVTSRIFFETESRKFLNEESSNPWNQLLWHSQLTVSKLIGALEEVAEGVDPESGFVVATLKRALHLIHMTISTLEAASSLKGEKESWQVDIRRALFSIRESTLNLMQEYRKN
tara:strand:- start:500 stop:1630 length:1131 start_codon:yes stop_codon:yes gene_type:complete